MNQATRLIHDPQTGQIIRVPARLMAPQRIRQSDVERWGSFQRAKAELWGEGGKV